MDGYIKQSKELRRVKLLSLALEEEDHLLKSDSVISPNPNMRKRDFLLRIMIKPEHGKSSQINEKSLCSSDLFIMICKQSMLRKNREQRMKEIGEMLNGKRNHKKRSRKTLI